MIEKENLYFYQTVIRRKSEKAYNNNEGIVISAMPFDHNEIKDLEGNDVWERLKDLGVDFLRKSKKIPSFAKEQDYEVCGYSSYNSYSVYIKAANILCEPKDEHEEKEIKLYNNAFDKIILPNSYKDKIIETIVQLKDGKTMFDEWGLGDKVKKGRGINMLFSGESGTGKTYCGEVIAEYLGTTAHIASGATIEDMYTGNSEKNINKLFKTLKGNNFVLIIDECDSFLSSRSDTNHVYNQKITNQLLIELERHNGICIMTTNRPVKLDKALQRRIDLVLDFPFPNMESRKKIWEYMIPKKMPTDGIDYEKLSEYKINGGIIKNAVLSAARKALMPGNNNVVKHELIVKSIVEELEEIENVKNGKDFS